MATLNLAGYVYNLPLNITDYHEVTLRQEALPLDGMTYLQTAQRNITLRAVDAIPANIILDAMPNLLRVPMYNITMRYTPDPLRPAFAVFPGIGDVDVSAAKYGPTGTEYQGTLLQPIQSNVKQAIQYGANGIEFTGTYAGGSGVGLASGSVLIDAQTGKQYIYITNPIIVGVQ